MSEANATGPIRAGVLTVSDRSHRGERADESGPLLARLLAERLAAEVTVQGVLPDDRDAIAACLADWCDELGLDLVFTTGGTGFSIRDVTPEAVRAVIEREAPGLSEAIRADGAARTPHALLSRGVSGIRGRTLIVTLPGSPKAVSEALLVLIPVLPHAVQILRGDPAGETDHTFHAEPGF
jgi:molybdopterin adenylyltransferase